MNKCGTCIYAKKVKVISNKDDKDKQVFFLLCKINNSDELLSSEEPACTNYKE